MVLKFVSVLYFVKILCALVATVAAHPGILSGGLGHGYGGFGGYGGIGIAAAPAISYAAPAIATAPAVVAAPAPAVIAAPAPAVVAAPAPTLVKTLQPATTSYSTFSTVSFRLPQ